MSEPLDRPTRRQRTGGICGDIADVKSHTVTGGGDIDIRVDETGNKDGQPILFVHGFSMSRVVWDRQLRSDLADDYRLVAMDVRGHGLSEKPEGEDAYADPELWAADIAAVIDELGLDDVVLVGWSAGAEWICDYLWVHGADSVAGVNFIGPRIAIQDEVPTEKMSEGFLGLIQRGAFASNDVEESMGGLERFVSLMTADPLPPKDHAFLFGTVSLIPPYVRAGMMARRVAHDDVLAALDSPVLIVHGEADDVMLPGSTERISELIPDVRTSVYPKVGHMPFVEATDRFNTELRTFVDADARPPPREEH